MPPSEKAKTDVWGALSLPKAAERHRLCYLLHSAHAVANHNRPLPDFIWLCQLDQTKGIDLGTTYLNNKGALHFVHSIASVESHKSRMVCSESKFVTILMDGATDISSAIGSTGGRLDSAPAFGPGGPRFEPGGVCHFLSAMSLGKTDSPSPWVRSLLCALYVTEKSIRPQLS